MSLQVLHTVLIALFKTQEQFSFKRKEEIRRDEEKQKAGVSLRVNIKRSDIV